MKISINLKPGIIFCRGNDYIRLAYKNGNHCFIINYYDINMQYTGSGYMTDIEIEKWINKNGFRFE